MLERFPPDRRDVYLTPEYARPFERCYGDRAELFVHEIGADVIVMPLLRRVLPAPAREELPEHTDLATPYGYGGPISSSSGTDEARWASFREGFARYCAGTNVLTEFQRLHPLLSTPATYRGLPGLRKRGLTVWVDLRQPLEAIVRAFRKGHRYSLARANAAGIGVRSSTADGDVSAFHALYLETMRHVGAARRYLLPVEFLLETMRSLGRDVWLLLAERHTDVVAGAMFLRNGRYLHYHLAAMERSERTAGAATLLITEGIRLGRDAGCTTLHLGGGSGSLYEFKRGFSRNVTDFWTYEAVHDAPAYSRVCPDAGMIPCYREDPDTL